MALIEIECLQVVLDPVVLLTCAMVRCRGGKSACHVFSDNAAFFHAEHGAIWSVVSGNDEH